MSISSGLPTHSAGYVQGDSIKSIVKFAQFYDGYGWFGPLTTLSPGTGYMFKLANAGKAAFA